MKGLILIFKRIVLHPKGEESDCSIPEELNENDTNTSISGSVNLQQNFMKPADYIVLEFGTPSCKLNVIAMSVVLLPDILSLSL